MKVADNQTIGSMLHNTCLSAATMSVNLEDPF